MPTQTRAKQFTTGRLSGSDYETGWQTLVDNINDWFALPTTNIIFLDAHIEVRHSQQGGIDSLTFYIMYLDSDSGVRVTYRAVSQAVSPAADSFDTWFASQTDANTLTEQPVWVGAADPLPSADTQFGKQFLYIVTDKTSNPNQLGDRTAVFAGVPRVNIPIHGSGLVDIFNSEGAWIAQVNVRNVSNARNWSIGDLGLVTVDTGAYGITAEFIGLTMCCANSALPVPP